jgi:hypothetical protein
MKNAWNDEITGGTRKNNHSKTFVRVGAAGKNRTSARKNKKQNASGRFVIGYWIAHLFSLT